MSQSRKVLSCKGAVTLYSRKFFWQFLIQQCCETTCKRNCVFYTSFLQLVLQKKKVCCKSSLLVFTNCLAVLSSELPRVTVPQSVKKKLLIELYVRCKDLITCIFVVTFFFLKFSFWRESYCFCTLGKSTSRSVSYLGHNHNT